MLIHTRKDDHNIEKTFNIENSKWTEICHTYKNDIDAKYLIIENKLGTLHINNVRVFSHVHKSYVYDIHGNKGALHESIVQLNSLLTNPEQNKQNNHKKIDVEIYGMQLRPINFTYKNTRSVAILPEPTTWIWDAFLKSNAKYFGKWIENQAMNPYMDFLFQSHSYEDWKAIFLDNYYPIVPNYHKESNILLKELNIDFIIPRIKNEQNRKKYNS